MVIMLTTFLQFTFISFSIYGAVAQTSYANEFVDPDYIVAGNFPSNTQTAQKTILDWATKLSLDGPWSVMNKPITPPSGTKHDYMSWAPYWWPDCSSVGNKTALSDEEVWKTCPYVDRDGQFNPDVRQVNDVGAFQSMSDAVLFNAIAWSISKTATFSQNTVTFIKTWFLDEATAMNPNLNYGQMQRGPDGQIGSHTGILDLKSMVKVTTAILILRKGKNSDWTSDLDAEMIAWSKKYITWLETADIAIEEAGTTNNHGTFYYNQLAALKLVVDDIDGVKTVTNAYFSKLYPAQIDANGEQPLEATRTRPYHYRAYNLAAMITNARLAKYADPTSKVWNQTTSSGATIKTALDFTMTLSAASSQESSYAAELYPDLAAVAATYGDVDGKYLSFLKKADSKFYVQPYFLWDQPWAASEGNVQVTSTRVSATRTSTSKSTSTSISSSPNLKQGNASAASSLFGCDFWFSCKMAAFFVTSTWVVLFQ